MKKILFWCPFLTHVGTIKAVINYASSLNKKRKFKTFIISAFGEWDELEDKLKKKNIKLIKIFNYKWILPKYGFLSKISLIFISIVSIIPLILIFKRQKPEYLISNLLGFVPILAKILSNSKSLKIIMSIQGYPQLNLFRKLLWRYFYQKSHALICLTNKTKDILKKKVKISRPIYKIDNPLILNNYQYPKIKHKYLKLLKTNKSLKIISIGRLTYQKNFGCLIDGVKNLKKKYPNFLLLIIGNGELLSKLQNKIDIYDLNKNIKLTGFIKNPYIFYKYADLYISSSRWEEPGHTLIEAAYYKTPIITSNCLNGPKEIFKDKSGIMFNNNDSSDLSKKINLFLSLNKNKKLKMINRAYKKTKTYKENYFYSEMLKILK